MEVYVYDLAMKIGVVQYLVMVTPLHVVLSNKRSRN